MMSAKVGSRLGLWGLFAAVAVAVAGAPTSAQASTPTVLDNPCVDTMSMIFQSFDPADRNINPCSPADQIPEVWNRNVIRNGIDTLNNYFRSRNPGGPVGAAMRRTARDDASAAQLAFAIDGERDLAAGYTPRESTGEFLKRHMEVLSNHNVNAWFNTTWSSPRDTHNPTRYDSDIWTLSVGMDMPIVNENLLFGVFGSYTNSDVDSSFNNGDVESKLGTIGPYFVYTLNEMLSFDTTVAAIVGQNENVVGPPFGSPAGTRDARGESDVDGFFVSMNANANYWLGNWGVNGRVGFLHSDVETESYDLGVNIPGGTRAIRIAGQNNELTQIAVASQINYFYDQGLPYFETIMAMPFFRVTWNFDLDHENIQLPFGTSQHPNDDDEVVLNWGVTLFGNGPLSGSVEGGRTLGRSRFEAWSVSGTVSYAF